MRNYLEFGALGLLLVSIIATYSKAYYAAQLAQPPPKSDAWFFMKAPPALLLELFRFSEVRLTDPADLRQAKRRHNAMAYVAIFSFLSCLLTGLLLCTLG